MGINCSGIERINGAMLGVATGMLKWNESNLDWKGVTEGRSLTRALELLAEVEIM